MEPLKTACMTDPDPIPTPEPGAPSPEPHRSMRNAHTEQAHLSRNQLVLFSFVLQALLNCRGYGDTTFHAAFRKENVLTYAARSTPPPPTVHLVHLLL